MSQSKDFIITAQQRTNAGKAAAANMTAEQRRARALKASHARKCMKDLPKATHTGELNIGNVTVGCAVLEDGRRIITETSMFELLKKSRKGRKPDGAQLPAFISPKNLKPFITKELETDLTCPVCDGLGIFKPQPGADLTKCQNCNGTGELPDPSVCDKCRGSGEHRTLGGGQQPCNYCDGTGKVSSEGAT